MAIAAFPIDRESRSQKGRFSTAPQNMGLAECGSTVWVVPEYRVAVTSSRNKTSQASKPMFVNS
jgi:hypothetical protein